MTLKAPRPKRSHTIRPPKRAKPYTRKRPGRLVPRWMLEAERDLRQHIRPFYPQAED